MRNSVDLESLFIKMMILIHQNDSRCSLLTKKQTKVFHAVLIQSANSVNSLNQHKQVLLPGRNYYTLSPFLGCLLAGQESE